jgi:LemA protein
MQSLARYWWIAALVLVAIFILSGMNSIPTLDEKVNASWAQVENQYQRRMDLIPNLVETVKGYANFEQKTLTDVIEARADATKITISPELLNNPDAFKQFEQAQGQLSGALSRLMAVSERYPDLKADQNFLALQSQLEGTENRISVARRDYIQTVQDYNIRVRTFPGSLWALIYGAKPKPEFSATEGADKPPAVKF